MQDRVDGGRIKPTKHYSGPAGHAGHHHCLDGRLVAGVEGGMVKHTAVADDAVKQEQEV